MKEPGRFAACANTQLISTIISLIRVQWFGCVSEEYETEKGTATAVATPTSMQEGKYRHFAVHKTAEIEIVYFCDLNPLVDGMLCYSSDRKATDNTWTGTLPSMQLYEIAVSSLYVTHLREVAGRRLQSRVI